MTKRPDILERLIKAFLTLPGIGPKAAERIVFHLLRQPASHVAAFSELLARLPKSILRCEICGTFDTATPCALCADTKRDATLICVVATPLDIRAIENTHEFHGRYHVLQGLLNPLEGVTPSDITIDALVKRVSEPNNSIQEVILALNPTVEGEATALYIQKALRRLPARVSKLARGLPLGAEVEYADEMTLADALRGRRKVE